MNYGTNPGYQSLMDSTGKYNPLAKEFHYISRKLSGNACKLYIELIHCSDMPSQRDLADLLGMNIKAVTKSFLELASVGLLIIREKNKSKDRYRLSMDRESWGHVVDLSQKQPQIDTVNKDESVVENDHRIIPKRPQIDQNLWQKQPQSTAHSLLLKKKNKKDLKKENGYGPFDGQTIQGEQRPLPYKRLLQGGREDSGRVMVPISKEAVSNERISDAFKTLIRPGLIQEMREFKDLVEGNLGVAQG